MSTKTIFLPVSAAARRDLIEKCGEALMFGRPFTLDEAGADRVLMHFADEGAKLIRLNVGPRAISWRDFQELHRDDWLFGESVAGDTI